MDIPDAGLPRRLLLAGSVGPERMPARPDRRQARWFEPLHVRDPAAARERIAGQVAAGADVVIAPTWLTHRRALLPVGETRQARAWSAAAVRVARDAIEMGLERRGEALAALNVEGDGPGAPPTRPAALPPRPTPLLAASLPALDEVPESGTGRLLPREAAGVRDYREQAGWLSEVEPDLLLVEGQAALAELRLAMGEARATGLAIWVAVSAPTLATATTEPLVEAAQDAGVERLLVPSSLADMVRDVGLGWGGLVDAEGPGGGADTAATLLGSGAGVIGLLDGAEPERLARIRTAIDDHERAELEARHEVEARWWGHVRRAAAMAPGGAALWLGRPERRPPEGFEWLVLAPEQAHGLPEERFRLIVDPIGGPTALARWAPILEKGGIMVLSQAEGSPMDLGLRLLVLDDSARPSLTILRRER